MPSSLFDAMDKLLATSSGSTNLDPPAVTSTRGVHQGGSALGASPGSAVGEQRRATGVRGWGWGLGPGGHGIGPSNLGLTSFMESLGHLRCARTFPVALGATVTLAPGARGAAVAQGQGQVLGLRVGLAVGGVQGRRSWGS